MYLVLSLIFATLFTFGQTANGAPNEIATRIYAVANESVGKEMWKPGYGLQKGVLGCAAAVCNVLKKAGITHVNTAVVTVMRNQLLSKGCQEFTVRNGEGKKIDNSILLKLSRPGDILVAFMEPPNKPNGGPNAHCGIMGQGVYIYTNNWIDGIWTNLDVHLMFDYYPYVRLLRFK